MTLTMLACCIACSCLAPTSLCEELWFHMQSLAAVVCGVLEFGSSMDVCTCLGKLASCTDVWIILAKIQYAHM